MPWPTILERRPRNGKRNVVHQQDRRMNWLKPLCFTVHIRRFKPKQLGGIWGGLESNNGHPTTDMMMTMTHLSWRIRCDLSARCCRPARQTGRWARRARGGATPRGPPCRRRLTSLLYTPRTCKRRRALSHAQSKESISFYCQVPSAKH